MPYVLCVMQELVLWPLHALPIVEHATSIIQSR